MLGGPFTVMHYQKMMHLKIDLLLTRNKNKRLLTLCELIKFHQESSFMWMERDFANQLVHFLASVLTE